MSTFLLKKKQLTIRCFYLHYSTVLAATLESLVHADCAERLCTAYRMFDFSVDARISKREANEVLKAYMVVYVQGTNYAEHSGGDERQPPYMARC